MKISELKDLFLWEQLQFGISHLTIAVCVLCSLLLLLQRRGGGEARTVLAIVAIGNTLFFSLALFWQYLYRSLDIPVLSNVFLLRSLFSLTLFLLYPILNFTSHRLNFRTVGWLFSPFLLFFFLLYILDHVGVSFRTLESVDEIVLYWTEFNVWIRILASQAVLIYGIVLSFLPYYKGQILSVNPWLRLYTVISLLTMICYLARIYIGSSPLSVFHYIVNMGLISYLTYFELYVRPSIGLHATTANELSQLSEESNGMERMVAPTDLIMDAGSSRVQGTHKELWQRLEGWMTTEQSWRNPNLTLSDLATAVLSNRTSISTLIKEAGYASFSDYVARYRIDDFCRLVKTNEVDNLLEAFKKVGYQSKSTAFYHFKKYMNTSPIKYIESIKTLHSLQSPHETVL